MVYENVPRHFAALDAISDQRAVCCSFSQKIPFVTYLLRHFLAGDDEKKSPGVGVVYENVPVIAALETITRLSGDVFFKDTVGGIY